MASSGTRGSKRRESGFGPNLAPLPKRPYDKTDEEIDEEVREGLKAHFTRKPPPPKEKVPDEVAEHFIRMARAPAPKPVASDYERILKKLDQAKRNKASSSWSKEAVRSSKEKSGKTVPQLGKQTVQSIPPLIVPTQVGIDPPMVITEEHRKMAAEAGCANVYQFLGLEPMEEKPEARKYVRGEPMLPPEEVEKLPTRMYELHKWYMHITKTTNRESLMVKIKAEHYYHEKDLWVEFSELFQLFKADAIDKSLVSCYCL
jgi:hypothetical protein